MHLSRAEFLSHIEKIIDKKVVTSRKHMESIELSIHSESKSTAGDKHDTSRELMQQERNKAAQNLSNQMGMQKTLIQLGFIQQNDKIGFGSFFESHVFIFIGIALGKIFFNNVEVVCISPLSPLARSLEGMKVGESCKFNNIEYKIKMFVK